MLQNHEMDIIKCVDKHIPETAMGFYEVTRNGNFIDIIIKIAENQHRFRYCTQIYWDDANLVVQHSFFDKQGKRTIKPPNGYTLPTVAEYADIFTKNDLIEPNAQIVI